MGLCFSFDCDDCDICCNPCCMALSACCLIPCLCPNACGRDRQPQVVHVTHPPTVINDQHQVPAQGYYPPPPPQQYAYPPQPQGYPQQGYPQPQYYQQPQPMYR